MSLQPEAMASTGATPAHAPDRVAHLCVILATYNRRAHTAACLESLAAQHAYQDGRAELTVICVDASSDDGTPEAVLDAFPGAHLISVPSSTFWAGAMRIGQVEAMGRSWDFQVWLNDDVELVPNALDSLLDASSEAEAADSILVGAVSDPVSRARVTYSGMRRTSDVNRLRFERVLPGPRLVEVETFNGNAVLMSRRVVETIGTIDSRFVHSMGDVDYGLRARRQGVRAMLVPEIVGTCALNPASATTFPSARSYLRYVTGEKRLPPKSWLTLCSRHAGPLWPIIFIKPYLKAIKFMFGKRAHNGF